MIRSLGLRDWRSMTCLGLLGAAAQLSFPGLAVAQGYGGRPPIPANEPSRSPRLSRLSCEGLSAMRDGLTKPGWNALTGFPLDEITAPEIRELEGFVGRCIGSTHSYDQKRGLIRISGETFFLMNAVRSREAQASRAQATQREKVELDATVASAVKEIEEVLSQETSRDRTTRCRPEETEVASRISDRIGQEIFRRHVEQTSAWKRYKSHCADRWRQNEQAAIEKNEKAQAKQKAGADQAIADYVEDAEQRHGSRLASLGLPRELLTAPLNLLTAFGMRDERTAVITLGQWLAMFVEAEPQVTLGGGRDRSTSNWFFSLKYPSERTMTFVVEQDGDDWFITRFRHGNAEEIVGQNEHAVIGLMFVTRSRIFEVANERTRQGVK